MNNPQTLKQELLDLIAKIELDDTIDQDLKDKLTDLITVVGADPSEGNLNSLTMVLDELANLNEYRAATIKISNQQVEEEILANSAPQE